VPKKQAKHNEVKRGNHVCMQGAENREEALAEMGTENPPILADFAHYNLP